MSENTITTEYFIFKKDSIEIKDEYKADNIKGLFSKTLQYINATGLDLYFRDPECKIFFGFKEIQNAIAANKFGSIKLNTNQPASLDIKFCISAIKNNNNWKLKYQFLSHIKKYIDTQKIENYEKIDKKGNVFYNLSINDGIVNILNEIADIGKKENIKPGNWPLNYSQSTTKPGKTSLILTNTEDPNNHSNINTSANLSGDYLSIKPSNAIYYGPPGTGKTLALINKLKETYGFQINRDLHGNTTTTPEDECAKRYAFVTFHQSYGYEEFVEGLRPALLENGDSGDNPVHYEIADGVFKRLCERAAKDPDQRYAMVIDEINRGNISKIFGELITLIEADKRGLQVALPYSGKPFSVPENVDLYGSMNTSDRSLALLDTALRRRFDFIPVMPDPTLLKDIEVIGEDEDEEEYITDINLESMLSKINERIEVLYDRDHVIGHAYFLSGRNPDSEITITELSEIFKTKIIPLLQEYFFDDWQKIRLVLGDNSQKEDLQFIHKKTIDNKNLFGEETPDGLTQKESYTYKINDDALNNAEAYIGIYT